MGNLIKIESDVFFICQRLKEVDESYQVFYNLRTESYEVHSSEQQKNSYCFKIPFDRLDERTIDYAVKTRSENRDKLLKEIELNNKRIEERNIKNQINLLKEVLCL